MTLFFIFYFSLPSDFGLGISFYQCVIDLKVWFFILAMEMGDESLTLFRDYYSGVACFSFSVGLFWSFSFNQTSFFVVGFVGAKCLQYLCFFVGSLYIWYLVCAPHLTDTFVDGLNLMFHLMVRSGVKLDVLV